MYLGSFEAFSSLLHDLLELLLCPLKLILSVLEFIVYFVKTILVSIVDVRFLLATQLEAFHICHQLPHLVSRSDSVLLLLLHVAICSLSILMRVLASLILFLGVSSFIKRASENAITSGASFDLLC